MYQFYYHSDHLGSSSLITNLDGEIVQHIESVPFGEVFIEERNNKWNTPFLFNAKELDEETGLYYYGARYYDPRISIFYGVDPLVEQTGTPYQYCYQNPVNYIDPLGMDTVPKNEIWEHSLINYRTDGGGLHNTDRYIRVKNKSGEVFHLHEIISGENEGNYLAIQQYGKEYVSTNNGIEKVDIYENMYVVGKDRVEDFRNGQTEGDGYLRGLVKVAVDGGMDGRASYWENCKTHVKNQLHPTNILFSFSTNPFDLKGIGKNVKGMVRIRPKAPKIETSVATPKPVPSIKPQGWNEFQTGRKGMYTKENYGSTKAAQRARSRDYQRMKDKN